MKLSDADISGTVGDKLQQGAGQEYASAVALKNAEFARAQPGCQRVLSGYIHNAQRPKGESWPGTQFTCFIGTKVQILTQKALQGALNELWLKDNPLRTHPFRQGLLPNLRVLLVDMGVQVV